MSPASHRPLVINLSKALGCRILSVDYRLAPESQFPTAIFDSVTALHYLFSLGIPAENIYVAGDSAGGNLSLATLLYARDEVRAGRMPSNIGGGILLSPWCDLTASLSSMENNVVRFRFSLSWLRTHSLSIFSRRTTSLSVTRRTPP